MNPLGAVSLAAVLASLAGTVRQRGLEPTIEEFGGRHAGVGVYVMLPLDVVHANGTFKDMSKLRYQLGELRGAGVDGFMVDVWWGITEVQSKRYDFEPYKELAALAEEHGLKVQLVASFHQCGGNVNDDCNIPLPEFVLSGTKQDIWFRDRANKVNREYISLFADSVTLDDGRTPLEMYSDWLVALGEALRYYFSKHIIVEVQVGLGPAGEWRYPSYSASNGWKYPGVGEFQVYDKYALESWRSIDHANDSWPDPPQDTGDILYNSRPWDTLFFTKGYASPYGMAFLKWYSHELYEHGRKVLWLARKALPKSKLAAKVAGVHWYYGHASHAAELTAGYYNIDGRDDPYREFAKIAKQEDVALDFTCLEMRDGQEPEKNAVNRPEKLVQQVIQATREERTEFHGENALPFEDAASYEQVLKVKEDMSDFTFLRLNDKLLQKQLFDDFKDFVARMHR